MHEDDYEDVPCDLDNIVLADVSGRSARRGRKAQVLSRDSITYRDLFGHEAYELPRAASGAGSGEILESIC